MARKKSKKLVKAKFTHQGGFLRDERKKAGLTQIELAGKLKVHPQFISNIERELSPIPPERGVEICKIFGATPELILYVAAKDFRENYIKRGRIVL